MRTYIIRCICNPNKHGTDCTVCMVFHLLYIIKRSILHSKQYCISKLFGVDAKSIKSDVDRIIAKATTARRKEESNKIKQDAIGYSDKVNPDYIKAPAAAKNEETLLGLLLLYPEHRRAVCDGKVALSGEHFFTSLGKRVFEAICEMENGEQGFDFSAMGERFAPDEMGRLVRLQQDRQALSDNSLQVLENAAAALFEAKQRQTERESGDLKSEIERRRAAMKRKN